MPEMYIYVFYLKKHWLFRRPLAGMVTLWAFVYHGVAVMAMALNSFRHVKRHTI